MIQTLPTFSAAQVANAAGVTYGNLNNWMRPDRGVITMGIASGGGHGGERRFTLRAAYQIALTAKLVRRGMSPQAASRAAAHFAAVGDDDRGPGELFVEGETYLCVDREGGAADLINVHADDTFSAILSGLPGGSQRDWEFIDVFPVVRSVNQALCVSSTEVDLG
jgi:hypothetical protein